MRLKRQINTTLSNYGESQEAKAELIMHYFFFLILGHRFCPFTLFWCMGLLINSN